MRDELDSILDFIDASSMTDDEWNAVEITEDATDLAQYSALLAVLDSRSSTTTTRSRLQYYFLAMGVEFPASPTPATTNIFLGDGLCS